jgi:excinuclease ABC subunit B
LAKFKLNSKYLPSIEQLKVTDEIVKSIKSGNRYQTLLGVTGSGKTFTVANIIEKLQKPTLIMTHNKTLASQLYSEFKSFFPNNHIEYFISYYDYYQPEAYLPRQDLYIEKDSSINEELERLRLSAMASLLSFDDVIVIASVSANYGLGNPKDYREVTQTIEVGAEYSQRELLLRLVEMGYSRDEKFFDRGNFRVNGEVIDIFLAYSGDEVIRVEFFGDEVERIYSYNYLTGKKIKDFQKVTIYSANPFIVNSKKLSRAISTIREELDNRLDYFKSQGKDIEYNRLKQRTEFDLEMLETTKTCKGVENYSRHLTGKRAGEPPYTLIDYFEEKYGSDYMIIVDESHVSLPQFKGMYAGDRSRKEALVEYGFRLPSALDNRPLKFEEYINKAPTYLFVTATAGEFELKNSSVIAEQIIRPTGLLDPEIEVIDSQNQVTHLYDEIKKVVKRGERVLVTTLTKKMAQELTDFYRDMGLKVKYMHSDLDAIERNQIIRELRRGDIDILIGINLLREGLDIPEVSLVAILDADKDGFLRSTTALIQTAGRAARNANGRVLMYGKRVTKSMQETIEITKRRRKIQLEHNRKYNITPKTVKRAIDRDLKSEAQKLESAKKIEKREKIPKSERAKLIKELREKMLEASKRLEFEEAAKFRDEIEKLKKL